MSRKRTVVLISGRGSNMTALIAAAADPAYPTEIVGVISDRPNAAGLGMAQSRGIATRVIQRADHPNKDAHDAALDAALTGFGAEIVALAGYMRILGRGLVELLGEFRRNMFGQFRGDQPPGVAGAQRRRDQGQVGQPAATGKFLPHQRSRLQSTRAERSIVIVELGIIPARLGVAQHKQLSHRHWSGPGNLRVEILPMPTTVSCPRRGIKSGCKHAKYEEAYTLLTSVPFDGNVSLGDRPGS